MIDFSNGKSFEYPYPHMVVEECFDKYTLDKLVTEFPVIYSQSVMGGRQKMDEGHPNFDNWAASSPTWKEFYSFMNGNDVFSTFMNYYKEYIEYWQGNVDAEVGKDCYLDMDWSVARDGYVREIHRDMPKRILGFLIFFSDKDWDGGDLVIHSSDDMIELPRQIWDKQLPVHNVIEAKKNRAIFFLSTPNSYHSVSLQSNTKSDRKFIYGAYSMVTGGAFGREKK